MIDALAQSYNHVAVRVGMDVQVERVAKIIKVLAGIDAEPKPSLILGAVDQTPFAIAQLYQFLASGGEVQPLLHAVRGVLDAHGSAGQALRRCKPASRRAGRRCARRAAGDAGDAAGGDLRDRACACGGRHGPGLLNRLPARTSGTSNDSRDSWFAGFTGSHLAVIWVGNDQNAETGFAVTKRDRRTARCGPALFKKLPSTPLTVSDDGMQWAWVSPEQFMSVDASCPGARRFAFVKGFAPAGPSPCDAVASQADTQGWVRVPSADDSNPEGRSVRPGRR